MVISCTVSELRRLIDWTLRIFLPLSHTAPPLAMFPLEFRSEVNRMETGIMGILRGESCMILTSTVFDWSTRVTDGQTDGDSLWRAKHYSAKTIARLSTWPIGRVKLGSHRVKKNGPVSQLRHHVVWVCSFLTLTFLTVVQYHAIHTKATISNELYNFYDNLVIQSNW